MRKLIYLILLTLLLVLSIRIYLDTTTLKVNYVTVMSNKLQVNEDLNILQISDLHNLDISNQFDKVAQLTPDIIVITGDLIDRKTTDLTVINALLEQLTATFSVPVFFVSGNHEWENPLFAALKLQLEEYGVVILDNSSTVLSMNNITFNLAGVADASTGNDRLTEALTGLDLTLLTILLSHPPILMDQEEKMVDLILSGHTHGGQVRLPLIGGLIAPDQGLFPEYQKDLYTLASGTVLYIDSGLGTSVLPIRLFNQSQISLIEIKAHD